MMKFSALSHHQNVGIAFFCLSGMTAIGMIVLTILIRIELLKPGLQVFFSNDAFHIANRYNGLLLEQFILFPALFCGFGYFLLPTQLNRNDMAFKPLNILPLGLFIAAKIILVVSVFANSIEKKTVIGGGWSIYPPISTGTVQAPSDNYLYLALCLTILCFALTALHFILTILVATFKKQISLTRFSPSSSFFLMGAVFLLVITPFLIQIFNPLDIFKGFNPLISHIDPVILNNWSSLAPFSYSLFFPICALIIAIISKAARQPIAGTFVASFTAIVLSAVITLLLLHFHYFAPNRFVGIEGQSWLSVDGLKSIFLNPKILVKWYPFALAFFITILISCIAITIIRAKKIMVLPMLWVILCFLISFMFVLEISQLKNIFLANSRLGLTSNIIQTIKLYSAFSAITIFFACWYAFYEQIRGLEFRSVLGFIHFFTYTVGVAGTTFSIYLTHLYGLPRRYSEITDEFMMVDASFFLGVLMLLISIIFVTLVLLFPKSENKI